MTAPTVVAALADALRSDPGRPLVTMYDDRSGERVELSLATFDNWVCKIANLFGAEWGLESGDLVSIALPTHWRGFAATVAAWTAGLAVTFRPAPEAALTLAAWDDIAAEVPGQPDVLVMPGGVTGQLPALVDSSGTSTHADLVARGLAAADAIGLEAGGRLLTDLNPASEPGVDVTMLSTLVTGSSVVLVADASTERRGRIATQERVTCTHWA